VTARDIGPLRHIGYEPTRWNSHALPKHCSHCENRPLRQARGPIVSVKRERFSRIVLAA
jgi:hypothetical protein